MHEKLLCDANVLIDYMNASHTLLHRLSQFFGGLFVPDIVYAEVSSICDVDPARFGIVLLETPFEALETIPGLSLQDSCCLFYALKGYCCITNDVKLRKTCMQRGCSIVWGLELLVEYNKAGQISKQEACTLARTMSKENPTLIEAVLNQFEGNLIPD